MGAAAAGAAAAPQTVPTPEPPLTRDLADFDHAPTSAHAPIRTFHPRRTPMGPARRAALDRLWPTLGFSLTGPPPRPPLDTDGYLDPVALFGRHAPLVLEVGSGMGEATVAMAAADAGRDYLAVEAHLPGVANLLVLADRDRVTNVRVCHGDALTLAREHLRPGSISAVHAFFPDPWPKVRHHKRRLIQPAHVALLGALLEPGGALRLATDWQQYAEVMLATIADDDLLVNAHPGYAPRPDDRPVTRFEQRARNAGSPVFDVLARRRA